jgi:hypothetical protein
MARGAHSGERGTAEFPASYNEAVAEKVTPLDGVLLNLLQGYQASDNFRSRRDRTRHDYIQQIKRIERDLGDFPLAALTDRRTRGVFMEWRDKLALSSRRQADYAWQVLALVLAWAKERGKITVNPCERGGRLYRGSRVDKIWTADDEAAFLRVAPAHLLLVRRRARALRSPVDTSTPPETERRIHGHGNGPLAALRLRS